MAKAKLYPTHENSSDKVAEPVCSSYETISAQQEKDLARAITGEELLNRLRPRIKELFNK